MGEYRDFADIRAFGGLKDHIFQSPTRIVGAVLVIEIAGHAGVRRPGEEYRRCIRSGIMNDLSKAEDRIRIAAVETVDEDDGLPFGVPVLAKPPQDIPFRCDFADLQDRKILLGIRRHVRGPLDLADFAISIWRNGDNDAVQ